MTPRLRRASGLGALACAAAMLSVPSAHGAVSCEYDESFDLLSIETGTEGDVATLVVDPNPPASEIFVQEQLPGGDVDCSPGAGDDPTVTNTAGITVSDLSGADVTVNIVDVGEFSPGTVVENGSASHSEIEMSIALGPGTSDRLNLFGGATGDTWRLGTLGLNWNMLSGDTSPDEDLTIAGTERIQLSGLGANDVLDARGGTTETGGPFTAAPLVLEGDEGDDVLRGGDGPAIFGFNDELLGGGGADELDGFAGNDAFISSAGDDQMNGGAGADDIVSYEADAGPVVVDLTAGTATGPTIGDDDLSLIERVNGTHAADTLIGDENSNVLSGHNGNDTFDGRGQADNVIAGDGDDDTVTYALAPAGVNAELTSGVVSGGAGNDSLYEVENLIGSPFADVLSADQGANAVTGLGGADTISTGVGPDSVDVRDGGFDSVSCGSQSDAVVADEPGLDSLTADCETVSFLDVPDPGGADTEIGFDLTAKGKQRVARRRGVLVTASCPLEACSVSATATGTLKRAGAKPAKLVLKPATASLAAGVPQALILKLSPKDRRKLKTGLRGGGKAKLSVSATATDAAANVATRNVVVKAKR